MQFRCPAFRVSFTPACWLVLPSQPDTLGGLAPLAFALETIDPILVSQCTFTYHGNCTINTCKERKPYYILNSKAYPSHQPRH